jgi:gamma-glutamylputrescine oxidase
VQTSAQPASYYVASLPTAAPRAALAGLQQADVCIIGGGFTGLNCAIELAERGFSVILLEARELGWGASGRNGGQLIRGLGHDLARFTPLVGERGVQRLQQLGLDAVQCVRQRIEANQLDCDLRWGFCDLANQPADLTGLTAQMRELQALDYPHPLQLLDAEAIQQVVGSTRYCGGLVDMGSGHLHPLKLVRAEAELAERLGVRVHEHSAVTAVHHGAEVQIRTTTGEVRARHLVYACNAYIAGLEPFLDRRVLPAGSFIIATQPLEAALAAELIPQNMAFCDQRVVPDYFRLSTDRRLLFGGACHYSGRLPQDIRTYMQPKMEKVFAQLRGQRIDFAWGGMIAIGANRLPQIGRLPGRSNVYFAQGYAGHGVAVTHLAGRLLAEAITGQAEGGFDLFARVSHAAFPGGRHLRAPLLALGMAWYRLKQALGRPFAG